MTLGYFFVLVAVMELKDLSLREKLLLSLVMSFNKQGLKMSNSELADCLNILPSRVSELLRSLESKGYIEIENRQSRHRKIYFRAKSKVGAELLSAEIESKKALLSTLGHSTFEQSRNITKELHKRRARKMTKPHEETPTGFERFYAAYPRKEGRKEAAKVWAKLNPDSELTEKIITAVERRKTTEQWIKENGRFIPKPATYLNGERWTDEVGGNDELTHDASDEEIAELERQGVFDG